jgi:hypothetical protein
MRRWYIARLDSSEGCSRRYVLPSVHIWILSSVQLALAGIAGPLSIARVPMGLRWGVRVALKLKLHEKTTMQEPYKQTSYFASPITIAAGVGMFVSAALGIQQPFEKPPRY